jgi:hypothetical protein
LSKQLRGIAATSREVRLLVCCGKQLQAENLTQKLNGKEQRKKREPNCDLQN